MPEASSRTTDHATFMSIHELDLISKSAVKKMSVPQKRAQLLYYVEHAPAEHLLNIVPENIRGVFKKDMSGKDSITGIRDRIGEWILSLDTPSLDSTITKNAKLLNFAPGPQLTPTLPNLQNSSLGYVLYEKLRYIDKGIEPSDDVVSQFSLAPGGKITLEKKSWSKTSIEFEESMSQLKEEECENSLSQNRELSEATSKQQQYNMSLSTSLQAQGNCGVYKVSANSAASVAAAVNSSRQESSKEKQEATHKAAARARREHKLTFKRASEYGTEYSRVEVVHNRNKFHPVRYRYYKAVKKWEIIHEVHGVRLCADVMVKNPGVNLRSMLPENFDANSIPPINWSYLPDDIEQEPPVVIELEEVLNYHKDHNYYQPVYFIIPPGYRLQQILAYGNNAPPKLDQQDDPMMAGDDMGLWPPGCGIRGHYVGNKRSGFPRNTQVTVKGICFRTPELENSYRSRASEQYIEHHRKKWELEQELKQTRDRAVDEQRTVPAAQILRQQERDEIASAVAQYILTGTPVPQPLNDSSSALGGLLGASAGRTIANIHHCFSWEEASYFLYPYWWDPSVFSGMQIHDILKLDHPDALRKAFVQASWARVLVPVRSNMERNILEIMYDGILVEIERKLADSTYTPARYAEIVDAYISLHEETTTGKFAQSENLVTSSDPMSDSDVEQPAPIVLSRWTEYTPTDETFEEMEILKDSGGNIVNIGEQCALDMEASTIDRSNAVNDILKDAKGKVKESKLAVDLADDDSASLTSEVETGN